MDRRLFLRRLLAASSALYLGCGEEGGAAAGSDLDTGWPDPDAGPDAGPDPDLGQPLDAGPLDCADRFADATFEAVVPFTGERDLTFHTLVNAGWDGRLYTDLARLDRDRLITPTAEFYVRTRFPDRLDLAARTPWRIAVDGLVTAPTSLALDDLLPLARPMGTHVMECSGNSRGAHFGLMSAASWTGIPLADVLDAVPRLPAGTRVELAGFDDHSVPSANNHSTPGASWIFALDQLRGAFLATGMNGAPLPLDHGFPVRLLVPGWYGCTCIKWLERLTFHDEDVPASAQMIEFASRTHQDGTPALARDFRPAAMQQAAVPVRVERWRTPAGPVFRVIGVLWGGSRPTDALTIRFGPGEPFVPVDVCPPMEGNETWTLFEHRWAPAGPGDYVVRCAIADPTVPTQRLDAGYYDRTLTV